MLLQPHSRCCCLPHHAAARASPNHPAFASAFAGFDQQVAMLPHAFACLTCPLHAGLLAVICHPHCDSFVLDMGCCAAFVLDMGCCAALSWTWDVVQPLSWKWDVVQPCPGHGMLCSLVLDIECCAVCPGHGMYGMAREYAEIEEKAAAEVQAEAKEKVRLSHSCVVKRVRHGEWASIV
eukprot:1158473-Pelagomonas_calceolata.AAC.5